MQERAACLKHSDFFKVIDLVVGHALRHLLAVLVVVEVDDARQALPGVL